MAIVCEGLGKFTVTKPCTNGHVARHASIKKYLCIDCWTDSRRKAVDKYQAKYLPARRARYAADQELRAFIAARAKAYRTKNAESLREKRRAKYIKNRDAILERRRAKPRNVERERAYFRKWRYGLDDSEYGSLLAAQEGKCAICFTPSDTLVVDHSHKTGAVRGLLCKGCNVGIGHLKDNPGILRSAAAYLEGQNASR